MNVLGWSQGRLRARLGLLVAVFGLVVGLHAVVPGHARALQIDCTDGVVCGDPGSGSSDGTSGTGDQSSASGDQSGGSQDASNGAGDDSTDAQGADSNDQSGGSQSSGAQGTGSQSSGSQGTGSQSAGTQGADDDSGADMTGVRIPNSGGPPNPYQPDAISGAGASIDPTFECAVERAAFLHAPAGSPEEKQWESMYVMCLTNLVIPGLGDPTITGRVDQPADHSLTASVAARQTTQARVQLHLATVAARAATKARKQARKAPARHRPAHNKRHAALH